MAGCTHTHPLTLSTPTGRAAVTARAAGRTVQLRLDGEPSRLVRDLTVDADTARWTDRRSGRVRAEPTARVRAVSFRRDGRGALTGAGVGLATGVLLGVTTDPPFSSRPDPSWVALNASSAGILGAVVGAMRSDRVVYRR